MILVQGSTNMHLAQQDGRITENKLSLALDKLGSLSPSYSNTVVRVDSSGKNLDVFNEHEGYGVEGYRHRNLSFVTGQLTVETRLKKLPRTWRDVFSRGARRQWEQKSWDSEQQYYVIARAAGAARSANLAEVEGILGLVPVYLGNLHAVKEQTGRQASFVVLPGAQKFIEGVSQQVLQVWTYLHGGNAVIDYQRASPARGTPVILS